MFVSGDVELARGMVAELQQVQRSQVAGRVVQEHIFRARVGGADFARADAGVPIIDGGVELDARISRSPGSMANLVPQLTGFQGFENLAIGAANEVPITVLFNGSEEFIGHTHRVVGVLARNRAVSLTIPIRVISVEFDLGIALLGELNHPLDVIVRNLRAARFFHRAF